MAEREAAHYGRLLLFPGGSLRTYVYIDACNLYYGCLKGTPYRWLDVDHLCRLLLPTHEIVCIKYFTARVTGRLDDLDQPVRQSIYLRALATVPNVEIYYGHFLTHRVWMPRATPANAEREYVRVVKTEEKGSDVNLATHLVHDAHRGAFQQAVLLTNDSDLSAPISLVRETLRLPVGILNPRPHPAQRLRAVATFMKPIRAGVLAASQFPPTLRDKTGEFHRPLAWAPPVQIAETNDSDA